MIRSTDAPPFGATWPGVGLLQTCRLSGCFELEPGLDESQVALP